MDMDLSIWVRAMINQWHLDLHRVGVSSPQSRHHGSELCAGVRIGPLACGVQVLHRRSAKNRGWPPQEKGGLRCHAERMVQKQEKASDGLMGRGQPGHGDERVIRKKIAGHGHILLTP